VAQEHRAFAGSPDTGVLLAERYRLGVRVGRGGMADVFAADDEMLHRTVAVKVFRFDTPAGDDQRRIDAEVRTLGALRHPGLVTVFDAGSIPHQTGQATRFIVMELIAGPTLAQRLEQGPLSPEEGWHLGAELAATLAYVHAQGIVHRDIKPANILLDVATSRETPFAARVTDFGIARVLDSTRLTTAGMLIGTANYLSPEQAVGEGAGPASDVYALGLVLLECLTGQPAYPGSGVEAAVSRLHRQPAIPFDLEPGWSQLLTAMTDRLAQERPTADQVAGRLAELGSARSPDRGERSPSEAATEVLPAYDPQPRPAAAVPMVNSRTGSRSQLAMTTWVWLAGTAVLLIALLAVVVLSTRHNAGTARPGPSPSYPAVGGSLGAHLGRLEGAVG
jgi:serine/threonine protein kinase